MNNHTMDLLDYIPCVPDFPKAGIMFRDISPLLANQEAFRSAIEKMAVLVHQLEFTHLAAIESRGFIFGAALAVYINKPLILIRKPNKLPNVTHTQSYSLEYGDDTLEIQATVMPEGARVLIVDDVIATGGTLVAAVGLAAKAKATVAGTLTLLQIKALNGHDVLRRQQIPSFSVLSA